MTPAHVTPVRGQPLQASSAWRADGIVMASLWTLVALLLTGIALAPKVLC